MGIILQFIHTLISKSFNLFHQLQEQFLQLFKKSQTINKQLKMTQLVIIKTIRKQPRVPIRRNVLEYASKQLGQGDQLGRPELMIQPIQTYGVSQRCRSKLTLTDQTIKCLHERLKLLRNLQQSSNNLTMTKMIQWHPGPWVLQ